MGCEPTDFCQRQKPLLMKSRTFVGIATDSRGTFSSRGAVMQSPSSNGFKQPGTKSSAPTSSCSSSPMQHCSELGGQPLISSISGGGSLSNNPTVSDPSSVNDSDPVLKLTGSNLFSKSISALLIQIATGMDDKLLFVSNTYLSHLRFYLGEV